MATFATLPGDLLTAIASYVDGPQIVVAVASDADARVAVRRGVDAAERALRGYTMGERVVFFWSLLVSFCFLLLCRCSWDCSWHRAARKEGG